MLIRFRMVCNYLRTINAFDHVDTRSISISFKRISIHSWSVIHKNIAQIELKTVMIVMVIAQFFSDPLPKCFYLILFTLNGKLLMCPVKRFIRFNFDTNKHELYICLHTFTTKNLK